MRWTRVRDWLIGALGMLLVLVVGLAVAWWVVSEPAGTGRGGSAPPLDAGPQPGARPPADLGEDEVWLSDVALRTGTVATADSRLRDVQARGRDVVTTSDGLVAAGVNVEATVPFEVVAAELGGGAVIGPAPGGQAMVATTVQALDRDLPVTATGTVEVQGGRLVIEPRSIGLGGTDVLSGALAGVVRGLVTIEHDIEGLPEGLVLEDVDVRQDGFRAHLRGQDVRLVP